MRLHGHVHPLDAAAALWQLLAGERVRPRAHGHVEPVQVAALEELDHPEAAQIPDARRDTPASAVCLLACDYPRPSSGRRRTKCHHLPGLPTRPELAGHSSRLVR